MPSRTIVSRAPLRASHAAAVRFPRRTTLAILIHFALCGIAIVAATHAPVAQAQSAAAQHSFQVAAGPLEDALNQFARQAGITLSFDPSAVSGRQAAALNGRHTVEQGFALLLAGSGLQAMRNVNGAYGLLAAPQSAAPAATEATLPSVNVMTDLSTTEGTASYTARSAATATRLGLSLRETPQSVSVITRQQIDDRNFTTLGEAMEMATGITGSTAFQGGISQTARGFAMASNLIDGLPNAGAVDTSYEPNLAFYDRVEVLRGAAGLVAEAGSAGGVLNLVRKRPTAQRQSSVTLRTGSWNNNYVELDGSSPLNEAATLRGRVVVAYQDRDTHIDAEYTRRPMFYGVVEADVGPRTQLHAGFSHERNDRNMAITGLPRFADGGDLGLPRSSRGYSPTWNEMESRINTVFAGIDHAFDDRWSLKLAATQQNRSLSQALFSATGAVDRTTLMGPTYGTDLWGIVALPQRNRSVASVLSGKFDLLGSEHDLVLGASWSDNDWGRGGRTAWRGTAPVVSDTVYDFDPSGVPRPPEEERLEEGSTLTTSSSLYGTTRLALSDPLKLILGGRLSWVETKNYNSAGTTSVRKENRVFTPYAGVTYDLDDRWSLYASYTDIFRVQNTQRKASGEPLKPVVGKNYEAGIKGELYDGRLNASFAVFRVIEENRAQLDPDNPTACSGGACYLEEGKVRGQGFETEISGEIMPGWQAIAGYTYVRTKYLRDRTASGAPSANEGRAFRSTTPEHLFKLWSTYRLSGDWQGVSVGGGVNLQSDVYVQDGNIRIRQGGYAVWNARVGYRLTEQWDLALNVSNLFDKHYYARLGSTSYGSIYGEPRSWMLTLRGQF